MTRRMWFYPAAAFALAAGLVASTAQASSASSALGTGVSEQGNLVQSTGYRNWRRYYQDYNRHRHNRDYNRHRHHQDYDRHRQNRDYSGHRSNRDYNRHRGW